MDRILFRERNGFTEVTNKINLNCQLRLTRGQRGKRDRRLYFLKKISDSDSFRILYPPSRSDKTVNSLKARQKISESICDKNTNCTVPSLCEKRCSQDAPNPEIKYFGPYPYSKNIHDKSQVKYLSQFGL